jgi:hypothetical protein
VFGSALSAIATVAMMTACGSSGSQASTQAASTHPAETVAASTPASTHPAGTASASKPASPHEFVSTRYGFAVSLPQDWSETDASFAWNGNSLNTPGSPFFANFIDPTSHRFLMGASAKVPKGMQLTKWQAAMVRAHLPSCSEPSSVKATTLGGEPALTWTETCDGGTVNSTKVAALHGGRGYMIYMPSDANNAAEDRSIFEAMRQSFRFTS